MSVIIPTLNEAANLRTVLTELPENLHEVIVVDGRSTDGTLDVVRRMRPDAIVITQTRRGKGNALACGFEVATGDVLVMLDADGSADPAEIELFVAALVAGADYAKGTRFREGGRSDDITVFRSWGNRWLNRIVNWWFSARYTDLCYGYNAFRRELLPVFDLLPSRLAGAGESSQLWGDGFEIETLMNVRVAASTAVVAEVGSVERRRLHGVSNLNAVEDGWRVLATAWEERRGWRRRGGARRIVERRAWGSVAAPVARDA